MSQSSRPGIERDAFERIVRADTPELLIPARFILDHAPAPLNSVEYLRSVSNGPDSVVGLLNDLRMYIAPADLAPATETNSKQCDVWSFFGVLLMFQGKAHQALEVFDGLYARMLFHQTATGNRFHKGLPLFHMSQC